MQLGFHFFHHRGVTFPKHWVIVRRKHDAKQGLSQQTRPRPEWMDDQRIRIFLGSLVHGL
jgi:hypothetical protein